MRRLERARLRASVLVVLAAPLAVPQTPPIKPVTPDVPVFPPFSIPTVDQELAKQPLTVGEAVAIALARRPSREANHYEYLAAKARLDAARSDELPQLSLNYSGSQVRILKGQQFAGSQGIGFRSQGSVSISQLIYDFGRTRAQVRQAYWQERSAKSSLDTSGLDVDFTTRQSFYGLTRAQALETASIANLANRRKQLDLAQARLDSGLGAPADVVRAKNTVADATIALTNARVATIVARIDLALAMGVDPRTPFSIEQSTEDKTEAEVDELVVRALGARPEIHEMESTIKALGGSIEFSRRLNAPSLVFNANLSTRGETDPLTNQTTNIGIGVTWPLWDGGLSAARTREARANKAAAEADLRTLVLGIIGEVVGASIEVTAAEQNETTALIQVENAKELLRISEGRYRGGVGQFLEVTDAQDAVFTAERNLATAQADLQTARAALRRAIGTM